MAGTDLVLVGDSLGMVIQGHDTTVPVTVDDMIYHTRCVARGIHRAFLIVDMPFMSYATPVQAFENAVRLMQEGGAMMVKLEGRPGPGRGRRISRAPRHSGLRASRFEAAVGAQDRGISSTRPRSKHCEQDDR